MCEGHMQKFDLVDPLAGWNKVRNCEELKAPELLFPITDQTFMLSGNIGSTEFCKVRVATVNSEHLSDKVSDNITLKSANVQIAKGCCHWGKEDDSVIHNRQIIDMCRL